MNKSIEFTDCGKIRVEDVQRLKNLICLTSPLPKIDILLNFLLEQGYLTVCEVMLNQ